MRNRVLYRYLFNGFIYSMLIIISGILIASVGAIHECKKHSSIIEIDSNSVLNLKDNDHIAIYDYIVEQEVSFRNRKYYIIGVTDGNKQPIAYMFTQVINHDGAYDGWLSSKDKSAYAYFNGIVGSSDVPLLKYEIKPFWNGVVVIVVGLVILLLGLTAMILSLFRINAHNE